MTLVTFGSCSNQRGLKTRVCEDCQNLVASFVAHGSSIGLDALKT
uniref:Uncharacterized protein n=1 Tax=Arundo donax TaxID=35708 RepID=A0A0A8ZX26_ARUDO